MAKKLKLKKVLLKNKLVVGLFVALFAGVGTYAILAGHAATTINYGTAWFNFRNAGGQVINGGSIAIYDYGSPTGSTTCENGAETIGGAQGFPLTNDGNGNFYGNCQVSTQGGTTNTYNVSVVNVPYGYQYSGGYNVGSQFTICANQINCNGSPSPFVVVVSMIDTDGDGVGNYFGDVCPNNPGPASNSGCPAAQITGFGASPNPVSYNSASTLSWSSNYGSGCNISPGPGNVGTSGSWNTGALTANTAYTLRCINQNGSVGDTRGLTVNVVPTASIGASASSIAYNSTTTINWSSTNATGCTFQQGYSNPGAVGPSGSWTSPKLTASTTYSLACSGPGGTSSTVGVGISVGNAPPPPCTSCGGGSSGGGSGGGGSSRSGGSSTKSASTPSAANAINDTQPPSTPGNFSVVQNTPGSVDLSWDASTDNVGVDHYTLDRSTDQATWLTLDGDITDTSYTDASIDFNTHYYYRVSAVDAAGNVSTPNTGDITTQAFSANIKPDEGGSISSDDNIVTVKIPAGAVSEPVFCEIVSDSTRLAPRGMKLAAGAYTINCKNGSSDDISSFTQPAEVTMNLKKFGSLKGFKAYAIDNGKLSQIGSSFDGNSHLLKFNQTNLETFAAYGNKSGSSLWLWITLPLALIGFGFLLVRYLRSRGGGNYYDTDSYFSTSPPPVAPGVVTGSGGPQHHASLPELVAQGQAGQPPADPAGTPYTPQPPYPPQPPLPPQQPLPPQPKPPVPPEQQPPAPQ